MLPSVREDMRQVASAPRELWVLGAVGAACAPVGAHKGVRLRAPTVSDFGFDPDHKAEAPNALLDWVKSLASGMAACKIGYNTNLHSCV